MLQSNEGFDQITTEGNMKSGKPFKRISQITMLLAVLIIIPLMFLSIIEIGGDGVGFSALYGRYRTERFLSCVEKGQFINAAGYMAFNGGRYEKMENKDEAKKEWAAAMEDLKRDGIELVSHKQNNITTDDGFTSGYVTISVKYKKEIYNFILFISTNNGKVEPGYLSWGIKDQKQGLTEVEEMLMEKISSIISTYNPG